jgi:hypothetical protein
VHMHRIAVDSCAGDVNGPADARMGAIERDSTRLPQTDGGGVCENTVLFTFLTTLFGHLARGIITY